MNNSNEYIVLARKYRPKKFIDLVGQEMLVEILSNAIPNNRLAHAYILTGVRGVGKTTTARLIAMSLNCSEREKNSCEPCGNCDSCKASGVDSNLDVIEMDAASNTGVDDVREIIENVKYKPIIGEYKIFIIDEVHMLSKNAFNALLKTLEEPPEHVKFIFATTEVKKIPITILSRCQRFDLHRIDNKNLSNYLQKIATMEKIEIDNEAISLIVRSADGSIRDALSLLDQANSNNLTKIDLKSITRMLGLAERSKIFDLLDKILTGNVTDSLNHYRNLYELGADVNMIFDDLLNVTHYITQIKISPNMKNDIYVPETERIKGAEIASKLTLNDISIIWQILFKGFQELQQGIHLFQHGEMIILRIIYFFDDNNDPSKLKIIKNKNYDDNKDINNTSIDNLDKIDNKVNKQEAPPNVKSNISISNYREFVDMFFKNREGLLHSKLYNDVSLVSFKEGEIVINTEKINDSSFNRTIAKLISKWTGRIWSINSSSNNLGKSLYEEDIINQQKEIEIMKNNSFVKKILFEFPESKIHSITDLGEINNNEDIKENKIKKE